MSHLLARMAPIDVSSDEESSSRSDDERPSDAQLTVDVATLAKLDSQKKASAQQARAQRKAAARLRRQEAAPPPTPSGGRWAAELGSDGAYLEREFPHDVLRVNVFARLATGQCGARPSLARRSSLVAPFVFRRFSRRSAKGESQAAAGPRARRAQEHHVDRRAAPGRARRHADAGPRRAPPRAGAHPPARSLRLPTGATPTASSTTTAR